MPLALSRTGVVFKKCYINNAGDFNRLARNVYKVLLTRGLTRIYRDRPPAAGTFGPTGLHGSGLKGSGSRLHRGWSPTANGWP